MCKPKQWGGHIEIVAAANMFKVAICIVTDRPQQPCDAWIQPAVAISDDVLLLGFNSSSQHYYSLQGEIEFDTVTAVI